MSLFAWMISKFSSASPAFTLSTIFDSSDSSLLVKKKYELRIALYVLATYKSLSQKNVTQHAQKYKLYYSCIPGNIKSIRNNSQHCPFAVKPIQTTVYSYQPITYGYSVEWFDVTKKNPPVRRKQNEFN